MSVTPGMPEHMSLGDRLSRLEKQVAKLNRARKLQSASIGSGGLKIKDDGSVQFVATDGTVILEIDKSAFTYDRADGSRILEVTPAGGLKIYETDGTTEKVVLDGDGLEVIGGMVTPIWPFTDRVFTEDEDVTGTESTVHSITVDPPDWVETLYVAAWGRVRHASDDSENTYNIQNKVRIDAGGASEDDAFSPQTFFDFNSSMVWTIPNSLEISLSPAGRSVSVAHRVWRSTGSGTKTIEDISLNVLAFGIRDS